jgi:ubiquinone/menaquinone biosynthesis C-methylase UbiE
MSALPPVDPLAATGFGRAAAEYERARPSYAAEAVAWIAERCRLGPDATVVDVGAGTGKLTRLLVGTGARVVAVEPVAAMRQQLRQTVAGVEALEGRAEALPLPDGCARAVTAAQAFHWFGPGAPAELARVLEPGGSLALTWNSPDESDPTQARLEEIYESSRPQSHREGPLLQRLEQSGCFGEVEERSFRHIQRLAREDLVTRVQSISFVAADAGPERERILEEVRAIVADLPPEVDLPYTTAVYIADKR